MKQIKMSVGECTASVASHNISSEIKVLRDLEDEMLKKIDRINKIEKKRIWKGRIKVH